MPLDKSNVRKDTNKVKYVKLPVGYAFLPMDILMDRTMLTNAKILYAYLLYKKYVENVTYLTTPQITKDLGFVTKNIMDYKRVLNERGLLHGLPVSNRKEALLKKMTA